MIRDEDAQRCIGFLEVVRTMIDNAELQIAGATNSKTPIALLNKAAAGVAISSKNLVWCAEEIVRIARQHESEQADGASVDRVSAGGTVVPAEKVGCDQVSGSAASASKYPA